VPRVREPDADAAGDVAGEGEALNPPPGDCAGPGAMKGDLMAETKTDKKIEPPKIERREIVKKLDCRLTEPEVLKYGRNLASINQQIDTAEVHKKSVVKELDSDIGSLEAQRSSIVEKINRGAEMRDVKVVVVRNFEMRLYHEERQDTGEVINERPLRDDERQPMLPAVAGNGEKK
jgi:hypothetical protein